MLPGSWVIWSSPRGDTVPVTRVIYTEGRAKSRYLFCSTLPLSRLLRRSGFLYIYIEIYSNIPCLDWNMQVFMHRPNLRSSQAVPFSCGFPKSALLRLSRQLLPMFWGAFVWPSRLFLFPEYKSVLSVRNNRFSCLFPVFSRGFAIFVATPRFFGQKCS